MAEQIQLMDLNAPRAIKPNTKLTLPVVWVHHLWLLRELKEGDEHVIRKVELKPGLNILWAESGDKQRNPELYENSVSGHAAGKTTFCRLLRYVLGEGNFGNDALRDAVRDKFKNSGWAVAEVHIRGTPWVVGRPLGIGARSFAIPDRKIQRLFDDHAHPEFDEYLKALENAVMQDVMVKRFASSGELIGWQHVLPWLARDQECRYRDLVEWRDPLSQAQSPAIFAADRQYLMRAMLALVSEQEQKELELNARLLAQNKTDEALLPKLQYQAKVDLDRLKIALEKELPDLGDDLFHQAVTSELDARLRAIDLQAKNIPSPEAIEKLQQAWQRAVSDAEAAKQSLEEVRETLAKHKKRLALLKNEITPQEYTQWLKSLPPSKGYCSVPLDIAREAGCKLAFDRATDLQSEAELVKTKDMATTINNLVNSLAIEVASKAAFANRREEAVREPRQKLAEAQTRQLNGTRELTKARDAIDELQRLATHAKKAWEESQSLAKKIKLTETEIEDSRKRQEKLRQQHMMSLGKFSDSYSQVIRAVMGKSLSAGVEFSGRNIALNLDYHGKLTSAAIESIKIIAFDLAAMLSSVEGSGFHPRFLIHDGPREADMSVEIYQKFFLFVRSMEAAFGESGPVNFQYIITTTEPPPTQLRRSPWLLETLNASEPEKRLFRADL